MSLRPCIVSTMKAVSLLRKKGCQGFFVNITEKKAPKLTIRDVPIVRDFLDAFSEDLLGVPADRQIEFTIDMVSGAASVSKAPYKTTPKELQELKVQIQKLLDKKFIRPSMSP